LTMYPAHFFAVHQALETIFTSTKPADKVLEQLFKTQKKMGGKDRGAIAEVTYGTVRFWRLLNTLSGREASDVSLEANGLRVGLWHKLQGKTVPALKECAPAARIDLAGIRHLPHAVRSSIPDWLEHLGENAYGHQWPTIMEALNQPAPVHFRINTLKISPKLFFSETTLPVRSMADFPYGAVAKERISVFGHPEYLNGLIEIQDLGSQRIGPFLEVAPGMRVVDACAGGGGKALHLAALMENKGQILAMDIHGWKLDQVKIRARRAGAHNLEIRVIENQKIIKRMAKSADRVLLDVPCSGLGVLRRNPDAKWKMQPERIEELVKLQKDILDKYSEMVKPGGKLVYATCSILMEENEQQIHQFLRTHPDFSLEEDHLQAPGLTDGFYMARMVRKAL
jgi:16S rRNA (cytosine967-C5)-methyltransferase